MKTLHYQGLFIIFLFIIYSCKSNTNEYNNNSKPLYTSPVSLTINIDSTGIGRNKWIIDSNQNFKQIYLTATLTNNIAAEIRYYSMSCSWTGLFTTNSKHLTVDQNPCYQNWWFIDKIPSYGKKTYNLMILEPIESKEKELQLAFNFIRDDRMPSNDNIIDSLQKMDHLIWSDIKTLSN